MKVILFCLFLCFAVIASGCARHQIAKSSLYNLGTLTQQNEIGSTGLDKASGLYNPSFLAQLSEETPAETDAVNFALASKGARPYTVLGRTYYPLKSAHGYMETGTASWYGKGFHGKKTSSGERYNQNALTAAHRLLPLGSVVTVVNMDNGRSVQVRINDRGPFIGNRVIDLSRAAANKLGMVQKGLAKVRIHSVGTVPSRDARNGDLSGDFFIQVGAFSRAHNAERLMQRLKQKGYNVANVHRPDRALHFVQIGPWKDLFAAQHALSALRAEYPRAYVLAKN